MIFEPRFAEAAGPLRFDDLFAVGVQLDVVAHATAKRASGVFHHGQAHCIPFVVKLAIARREARLRPDRAEITNVHPDPFRKAAAGRRGWYRPGRIISHARTPVALRSDVIMTEGSAAGVGLRVNGFDLVVPLDGNAV